MAELIGQPIDRIDGRAKVTGAASYSADSRADRFALVIGNAKYPDAEAPLKEPINDAREIADELKRDGFNVEVGENLNGDGMRKALRRAQAEGLTVIAYVAAMFSTGHDAANREVFHAEDPEALDLVGIGLRGPRKAVDKAIKGLKLSA